MITVADIRTAIGASAVRELTRLSSAVGTEITEELEGEVAEAYIAVAEAEVKAMFAKGVVEWDDELADPALNYHIAQITGCLWMKAVNDGRDIPSCASSVQFVKEVAAGRKYIEGLETSEGLPHVD